MFNENPFKKKIKESHRDALKRKAFENSNKFFMIISMLWKFADNTNSLDMPSSTLSIRSLLEIFLFVKKKRKYNFERYRCSPMTQHD